MKSLNGFSVCRYEDGLDLLLRCVKTLQIRDWSFFGGDPNDI